MRIWLTKIGEPLPVDDASQKLHRTGTLAEILAARGHEVTWWSSTFDHWTKRHRFRQKTRIRTDKGIELVLLPSRGYSKNVSPGRFLNDLQFAWEFRKALKSAQPRPDVILGAFPTIEVCIAATRYGRRAGVPVILDLRDMWPDIFVDALRPPLRQLGRPLLAPLFYGAHKALADATALTGISPDFVNWGLRIAGREATPRDRHFWMASVRREPPRADLDAARRKWNEAGLDSPNLFLCAYVGVLSNKIDIDTLLGVARILDRHDPRFRFVLCGVGDELENFEARARGLRNVLFPGWVNAAEMRALLNISKVGLVPVRSRVDFVMSVPTKAIDYLAAGLPVVSSLQGLLKAVLADEQCGLTYEHDQPEQLAAMLIELANDDAKLSWLRQRATAVYEREFVGEVVYSNMADYLERIATERSGAETWT